MPKYPFPLVFWDLLLVTPNYNEMLQSETPKKEGNENVTTSTIIWSIIFLLPLSLLIESPWNSSPSLESTLSLIYLGAVATGAAWQQCSCHSYNLSRHLYACHSQKL